MQPEFSQIQKIENFPDKPFTLDIVADELARQGLAKRFNLQKLTSLSARLTITPLKAPSHYKVDGQIQADYTQTCVVSLQPLAQTGVETFSLEFVPLATIPDPAVEHELVDTDLREPIIGGVIDFGEVVAQQFGLMLDPYPRQEGSAIETFYQSLPPNTQKTFALNQPANPFAKLATLQKNREKNK